MLIQPATLISHPLHPLKDPVDYQNDHIYEIFRKFSQNFAFEIYARVVWNSDFKGLNDIYLESICPGTKNPPRLVKGKQEVQHFTYFVRTRQSICQTVHQALMTSLFGKKYHASPHLNQLGSETDPTASITELKTILNTYDSATASERQLTQDKWIAYSFEIRTPNGHDFVLIQSVKNQKVVYKIFQAYMSEYTLEQYLVKNDQDMTLSEVNLLLDELLVYMTSSKWIYPYQEEVLKKSKHLYSHFFKVKFEEDNEPYRKQVRLNLRCGKVTRAAFIAHAQDFNREFPSNLKFKCPKTK